MNTDDTEIPRLDGLVALITGAAGDIGGAVAHQFARLGAALALADVKTPESVENMVTSLRARGARHVTWHPLDLRNGDSCRATTSRVAEEHGGLNILINNAGVTTRHDFASTSEQEWRAVLDVNLNGTFRMCQAALPMLRDASYAAVVNIGSTAGAIAIAGSAAYGVSKAAVMHLTRVLALEWAPLGIRVNAVAPTIVPTAMTHDVRQSPAYVQAKLRTIPLGRMASPLDVAYAVAFLASGAAAMTTGHVLFVDGGATVH